MQRKRKRPGRPEREPSTELGARLRGIRKARDLTLVQFSRLLRMPVSSIAGIETGDWKTIPVSTAQQIAERLGVRVTDIIGGE